MENIIEATGKTIEEAKNNAAKLLGKSLEELSFEIIDEPRGGFLGFGAKDAKVKATVIKVEVEETVEKENSVFDKKANIQKGKAFLEELLKTMDRNVEIEVIEDGHNHCFNLIGENMGLLIGKRGQTLDAIQYLVNMAANKNHNGEKVRIILDIENYRKRREESLYGLAYKTASRVRKNRRKVVLEPMNRYERKIIHLALQDQRDLITFSQGVEPYRNVVVDIKHNKNENLVN